MEWIVNSYHINHSPAMQCTLFSLHEMAHFRPLIKHNPFQPLYFTVQRRVLIYLVRTVVYCFHVWWGVHSQDLCCLGRISTVSRLREYD